MHCYYNIQGEYVCLEKFADPNVLYKTVGGQKILKGFDVKESRPIPDIGNCSECVETAFQADDAKTPCYVPGYQVPNATNICKARKIKCNVCRNDKCNPGVKKKAATTLGDFFVLNPKAPMTVNNIDFREVAIDYEKYPADKYDMIDGTMYVINNKKDPDLPSDYVKSSNNKGDNKYDKISRSLVMKPSGPNATYDAIKAWAEKPCPGKKS